MDRTEEIFETKSYDEVVTGEQIIEEAIKHIYPNKLDKYTTKTHYDYMEEKQEILDYIIENFNLVRKRKPA